jgi:hypothetical protein
MLSRASKPIAVRHALSECLDMTRSFPAPDKWERSFLLALSKIGIYEVHPRRVNPDERLSSLRDRVGNIATFEHLWSSNLSNLNNLILLFLPLFRE